MGVGQAELGREGVPGRGTSKAETGRRRRSLLCGRQGGEGSGFPRPPSGSPGIAIFKQWGAMERRRALQGHPGVCFQKSQPSCPSLAEASLGKRQTEDKLAGYLKITNLRTLRLSKSLPRNPVFPLEMTTTHMIKRG